MRRVRAIALGPTWPRRAILLGAGGLLGLVSGCGDDPPPAAPPPPPPPAPPPSPTILSLTLRADPTLNPAPNGGGGSAPAVVRLFQLTDVTAFSAADWFVLSTAGVGDLGGEVVLVEERVIAPGNTLVYQKMVEDGARYLGVVVGLKDLSGAWRSFLPLPPETTSLLELELFGNDLTLRKAGV